MDACPRLDDTRPDDTQPTEPVSASQYDIHALAARAVEWRAEAARVTSKAMRRVCLKEAERCEQRIRQSLSTPVLR
jgi:hypothetical protein